MATIDLSFRAIGPETLALTWPVFVAFAGVHAAFVTWVNKHGPPSQAWIVAGVLVPTVALLALSLIFESAAQAELMSQGVPPLSDGPLARLVQLLPFSAGPLLWVFGMAQGILIVRPKANNLIVVGLAVASALALSWLLAIWLYLEAHGLVVTILSLPGGLAVGAALPGFVISGAMWAGALRWWISRDRSRCAV